MKIAIATDAWSPQVNGVVTTLQRTAAALEKLGNEVRVFSSLGHRTIPCPTYPEIRLALWPGKRLGAELDAFAPDAIHVATEGPLGISRRAPPLRLPASVIVLSYSNQTMQGLCGPEVG